MVYEFSLSTNRRGIFIQQTWNANHFEVISELVSVANEENVAGLRRNSCLGSNVMYFSSSILGEDNKSFKYPENTTGVPPAKKAKHTADPSTSKTRLETHVTPTPSQNFCNAKCDQNFPMLPLSENGTETVLDKEIPKIKDLYTNTATVSHSDATIEHTTDGNSKSAHGEFCGKCLRQSTLQYPLKLTKKEKSDFKNRTFGNRIKDAFPILCNQCLIYCTSERIKWSHAWPSDFFTLLRDEKMPREQQLNVLTLLSWELRLQWMGCLEKFTPCVQQFLNGNQINGKCVVDGTARLHCFQKLIKTLQQEQIAVALDKEPYPNVRCPFGCWFFIEESGFITAKQFLNLFDPTFTSFGASSLLHLGGVRSDFLVPTSSLPKFLIATTVRVDEEEGLVVHACPMHSKGSSVQYLHPPSHPACQELR